MSSALRELDRKLGDVRIRGGAGGPASVSTGIPQLDALLPGGGLPRGRAVEWAGPRSCGKTTVLRSALERLYETGEAVAVVDASRTLYAPDWAGLSGGGPFWVVRAPRREAAWCADLLLRSGAFGAVALGIGVDVLPGDGGARPRRGELPRGVAVRLQRLAEEAGAVFVVVGELPLAALRLRFRPGRLEPVGRSPFGPILPPVRPVWARVGEGRSCEVPILCPAPPDRSVRPPARDRKGPR